MLCNPCSFLAIPLYLQVCVVSFFFLMSKSLFLLFNCFVFPVSRQMSEKTESDSKDMPTFHFLAQYFNPDSSLREFTRGLEVEYAMWKCRWEGSTSGRLSKETARKRNLTHCHSSIHPCWGCSCSQPLCHPSKMAKKGAPGHKRSCSAALTSLLLDTRFTASGRRVKWQGHLEAMVSVRCTTGCG